MRVIFILAATFLVACNSTPPSEGNDDTILGNPTAEENLVVDLNSDGLFTVQMGGDTFVMTAEDYRPFINEWMADQDLANPINLILGPNLSSQLNMLKEASTHESQDDDLTGQTELPLQQRFGNYFLSTGPLARGAYVGGQCIRQITDLKYSIRLNQIEPSSQRFDMHLAKYTKNGRFCVGYYESVGGSEACTCNPIDYSRVRDWVYGGILAIGVSAGTAWLIAQIATPLAFGALAL